MLLIPIIILVSFTLWTIFQDEKIGGILRLIFLFSLGGWIFFLISHTGSLLVGFPSIAISFLAIAAFGFVIQNIVTSTIGRVILASLAVSPFIYWNENPNRLPLHINIETEGIADANQELIIKCRPSKLKYVKSRLGELEYINAVESWDVKSANITDLDDYLLLDINDTHFSFQTIEEIGSIPGVIWIEKNETWSVVSTIDTATSSEASTTLTNDPRAKDQWNYSKLRLDEFHNIITSSGLRPRKPAKLFILDSGINYAHEDLKSTLISNSGSEKELNESDKNGHGTHCAGVAGAVTNNGIGIASFNPGSEFVQVSSIAVLNRFGLATQASIIEGIIEAVDAGADVINMSFGSINNQLKEEAYEDAFAYAKAKNVILIAAAGNSNADASNYVPSGRDEVITVTATNRYDEKAQFSNYIQNTNFGIAAPGTSILSTYKNGYSTFDGTSMAAPHVAGLVTVLRSIRPDLTTAEAHSILDDTGLKTNDTKATGRLINPVEAIKAVMD